MALPGGDEAGNFPAAAAHPERAATRNPPLRAMAVLAVAPGVWRITTPLPFRPRSVHAYLAATDGNAFLLLDGGIDTPAAWRALDDGVREVAGGWARVAVHVVTHMHLDHIGLARRVREAADARLVMSRLDADRARHAEREPGEEAQYREALLLRNGAPADLIAEVQAGRERAASLSGFVEPDEVLDGMGGPVPGTGGWSWVWTPGHTAGHLSLFRADDRLLLAGDAVLPRITPTIGVNRQREDPVGDYLDALDRLGELRPALVLPCHGDPIADPADRLRELSDATRQESQRILGLLDRAPATAWTVTERRHPAPDLPAAVRMLALRETLAHLDHLVAAGRVRRLPVAHGVDGFVGAPAHADPA
jgi:glyoxylase-like metal-dependent hydrolase (beta-lactamase superfamily II)